MRDADEIAREIAERILGQEPLNWIAGPDHLHRRSALNVTEKIIASEIEKDRAETIERCAEVANGNYHGRQSGYERGRDDAAKAIRALTQKPAIPPAPVFCPSCDREHGYPPCQPV